MSWYEYCLHQDEIPSSNNVIESHRSSTSIYLFIYVFFIGQQSICMNFIVFLLIFSLPIFFSKYSSIFLIYP